MANIDERAAGGGLAVTAQPGGLLFNPGAYDGGDLDLEARRLMLATIEFFESRGKRVLKEHDRDRVWYADFLDFIARERLFATLLTPADVAGGDPDKRWDTSAQCCAFNEILRFLRPAVLVRRGRCRSSASGRSGRARTPPRERRAAALLDEGAIFAFGLSEREHGADIYSHRHGADARDERGGSFAPTGEKYYIGNGNVAGMVSVFGRRADLDGPDGYVFFAADSRHQNYAADSTTSCTCQMYVSDVPARGLPGAAPRTSCTPARRLRGRAQHGQRRQVQPVLRLDRDVRARLLRGDHARDRTASCTATRSPTSRTCVSALRRRVRPPGRDEAVQRPSDRLFPHARARGPALPALQPDGEDEGHHARGRRSSTCCGT